MSTAAAPLQFKNVSIPPLFDSLSWTFAIDTPLTHQKNHGSQTLQGRLVANFTVESQEFFDNSSATGRRVKRMIHVDLNESTYGAPSQNILDQNDMRGFYVESIRYHIWLQTPGDVADVNHPAADWEIVKESPDTSNGSGSVSSSISWGFNASAGMFGDMPTASVGGNFGVSNNNSHSLTDFTFTQYSTANVLDHVVRMTQTGDGHPYSSTTDLYDPWQSPFVGVRLRPLPDLAKSNVPLVGQAIWMNKNDAALVDKLIVNISIVPHWVLIEASFDGSFHGQLDVVSPVLRFTQDIDFSLLK